MTVPNDALEAEFVALAAAHNALAALDPATRGRVLARLCARFMPELPLGLAEQRAGEPREPSAAPGRPTSITTVEFGSGGFTETTTWTSAG